MPTAASSLHKTKPAANKRAGETDAKVEVLSEYVKHHVKEEEEELFPALLNTDMDMNELGARLATSSPPPPPSNRR